MFNVEGKTSYYNPQFRNLSLFSKLSLLKSFINYSVQDSIALLEALNEAHKLYIKIYKVDITTKYIYTISLKKTKKILFFFRQQFLSEDIPILSKFIDNFSVGQKRILWWSHRSLHIIW